MIPYKGNKILRALVQCTNNFFIKSVISLFVHLTNSLFSMSLKIIDQNLHPVYKTSYPRPKTLLENMAQFVSCVDSTRITQRNFNKDRWCDVIYSKCLFYKSRAIGMDSVYSTVEERNVELNLLK